MILNVQRLFWTEKWKTASVFAAHFTACRCLQGNEEVDCLLTYVEAVNMILKA